MQGTVDRRQFRLGSAVYSNCLDLVPDAVYNKSQKARNLNPRHEAQLTIQELETYARFVLCTRNRRGSTEAMACE